jgi:hypothetical protein
MPQVFDDLIFNISTTINTQAYQGGKLPWGQLIYGFFATPPASSPPVPPYAMDPPIPPVWPSLGAGKFSSDTIYGKERMNTNIQLVRGDNYIFDCIAVLDGNAVDLSLANLTLTCKKNLNDTVPFFQLTSSPPSGILITNAPEGKFTCTIAGNLTASLPAYIQRFPYDIELTKSGNKNTLARGYLIIVPDVS